MSVIRWNPLREFDDLFAHTANRRSARSTQGVPTAGRFTPLADIAETEAGYVIELELPGFAAADVAVTVHDGVLSVAGERQPTLLRSISADNAAEASAPGAAAPTAQEMRQVHLTERAFGKFERRFRLPKDADVNGINATASNGVLTLEIARLAETGRLAVEVKVA